MSLAQFPVPQRGLNDFVCASIRIIQRRAFARMGRHMVATLLLLNTRLFSVLRARIGSAENFGFQGSRKVDDRHGDLDLYCFHGNARKPPTFQMAPRASRPEMTRVCVGEHSATVRIGLYEQSDCKKVRYRPLSAGPNCVGADRRISEGY